MLSYIEAIAEVIVLSVMRMFPGNVAGGAVLTAVIIAYTCACVAGFENRFAVSIMYARYAA